MGVQAAADSGVGGVNQRVAEATLRGPQEYVDRMRDAYHQWRVVLAKSLEGTGSAGLVSGE